MCIIPFWLVGWKTAGWPLGDCWLAPGKAAGWPLGRLLLLAALGGCWLAPGKVGWPLGRLQGVLSCWFLLIAFAGWISGYGVDMTYGTSLGTGWICFMAKSQFEKKPIWPPMFKFFHLEYTGFQLQNENSWILMIKIKVGVYFSYIWETVGLFLSVFGTFPWF